MAEPISETAKAIHSPLVKQFSIFLENKVGALLDLTRTLSDSNVHVCGISVVDTADATLVCPKDRAQDVKQVVELLRRQKAPEHLIHKTVHRPWGSYKGLHDGHRVQVKHIVVKPGGKLSLQMHHHHAEHWVVVQGTAKIVRGNEEMILTEDQSTYIPLGTPHRLENPGKIPLHLIEVQSGSYLGEDDIVRFDDHYGRD